MRIDKILSYLFLFTITISTVSMTPAFSGFNLLGTINLSNTPGDSDLPQISSSGSNVYVVWREETTSPIDHVFFTASTDNGNNFTEPINLSNTLSGASTFPQISSSGSNVYVTWEDTDPLNSSQDIFFTASTDNGGSFTEPINLSNTSGVSVLPQIESLESNVYVVWRDTDPLNSSQDIFFTASTDNGGSFTEPINLSNTSGVSTFPQIESLESNVYVVWRDTDPLNSSQDIFFTASTDNGGSFTEPINLSNTSGVSVLPQIESLESNVYVVWQEFDLSIPAIEILFTGSTDNGNNFTEPINLSNTLSGASTFPQISSSGSNVYVTWEDTDPLNSSQDIFFTASTDNGGSFTEPINLSNTLSGNSNIPQISSSGSTVYITWEDTVSGNKEILFTASTDNGNTFGTVSNLSVNSGDSKGPQITISDSLLHVVWEDFSDVNPEVLYKSIMQTPIDIVFNKSQYKLSDTVALSITDLSSNTDSSQADIIFANVSTTTDPAGIQVLLTETGTDTGHFVGSFIFTSDKSLENMVQANAGDTVVVSFKGVSNNADIFARKVSFDNPFSRTTLSALEKITVKDPNSNQNSDARDKITVKVISTTDSQGILLTLTETENNSQIFTHNGLVFSSGNTHFKSSDVIRIIQEEPIGGLEDPFGIIFGPDGNLYVANAGTSQVLRYDGATGEFIDEFVEEEDGGLAIPSGIIFGPDGNLYVASQETSQVLRYDGATGEFIDEFVNKNSGGLASNNVIDTITITAKSTSDTTGIELVLTEIGPNKGLFEGTLKLTKGASSADSLGVNEGDIIGVVYNLESSNAIIIPNPDPGLGVLRANIDDIVTASFFGVSDDITIGTGPGGGGGGGGALRPQLVVDVVASLIGGGGRDSSPPAISLGSSVSSLIPEYIRKMVEAQDPNSPILPLDVDNYPDFDFPFSINGTGYLLSGFSNSLETYMMKTGDTYTIMVTTYDSSELQHMSLYTNLRDNTSGNLAKSDTQILYNAQQPLQIIDPNGYFDDESLQVTILEDGVKKQISFQITPIKPMEKSDLIIRAWDVNRNSFDTILLDAIEIQENQKEDSVIKETTTTDIKNDSVTNTIPSLETELSPKKELIMSWSGYSENIVSDSEFLSQLGFEDTDRDIPSWLKQNVSRLLYNEMITEQDFLNAIKYIMTK